MVRRGPTRTRVLTEAEARLDYDKFVVDDDDAIRPSFLQILDQRANWSKRGGTIRAFPAHPWLGNASEAGEGEV